MPDETPQFEHDCEDCTFLGRHAAEGGSPCDLYHCLQGRDWPTVIARWSDEGADYTSGAIWGRRELAEGRDTAMAEAYRRAKERGLDVGEGPAHG